MWKVIQLVAMLSTLSLLSTTDFFLLHYRHCRQQEKMEDWFCCWKFGLLFLDFLYPGETKLKTYECSYWIHIAMNPSVILLREAEFRKNPRVLLVSMETIHGSVILLFLKGMILGQGSVVHKLKCDFCGNLAFSRFLLGSTISKMTTDQPILVFKNTNNRFRALLVAW